MRLRAFYDDACFTVAAQDAFLSGFAAEVAHALNIKVDLVIDLNAFHTDKHNEMEVRGSPTARSVVRSIPPGRRGTSSQSGTGTVLSCTVCMADRAVLTKRSIITGILAEKRRVDYGREGRQLHVWYYSVVDECTIAVITGQVFEFDPVCCVCVFVLF